MGQHANSSYPVKEGRTEPHAQTTIAQQLDGAERPKDIGTFKPSAPMNRNGSENVMVKNTRSVGGGEIRLDTTDISNALRGETTRRVAKIILDAVAKLAAIDEDHQAPSTKGKLIKMYEALYPGRFTAANEDSYVDNEQGEMQIVEESTEKSKEEEQKAKNFSQWGINHHISIIQRRNNKETASEIKPAMPEEIAEKNASKILRPFLSAKRNEVKVKANENNLQPITPEAIDNIPSVVPEVNEVVEHIQDIPHSSVTNEEITVLDTQSQTETETTPAVTEEETTITPKSVSTNPFTKLTGTIPEDTEESPSEILMTDQDNGGKDDAPEPVTSTTIPRIMSRFGGEYAPHIEDSEISTQVEDTGLDVVIPETSEIPNELAPVNESERSIIRNRCTAKLLSTMEVYYGNDWSKYMMVKKGREDRIDAPPVQGLPTVERVTWQFKLSPEAAKLMWKLK